MLPSPALRNFVRTSRVLVEVDPMSHIRLDIDLNVTAPTESFDGGASLAKQSHTITLTEYQVMLSSEPEHRSLEGTRVIVQGTLSQELADSEGEFSGFGVFENRRIEVSIR